MFVKRKKLQVIDGETLMDLRLEPTRFCVDTLLPQGACMLSGAAKIGKSWMVLDWCVRIAKGEPVWNLPTHRGSVLYLALEDRMVRIQGRRTCSPMRCQGTPTLPWQRNGWTLACATRSVIL